MHKSHDVIPACKEHEAEDDKHSDKLHSIHEVVARLFACDHFIKSEYDVPSIKSRYRKEIHHAQYDGNH